MVPVGGLHIGGGCSGHSPAGGSQPATNKKMSNGSAKVIHHCDGFLSSNGTV